MSLDKSQTDKIELVNKTSTSLEELLSNQKPKHEQSRSWVFTLSAKHVSEDELRENLEGYTWIGQLERGEGGYEHYQGYIENETPIRFSTLKKKFPTIHLEIRKGTQLQAYEYVTKEETRIGQILGNMEKPPEEKKRGRGEILKSLHERIQNGEKVDDIILTSPEAMPHYRNLRELESVVQRTAARKKKIRDMRVTYLYGETGVGKTRYVYETYDDELYRVTDYDNPFDRYNGEKVLVLDEFNSQLKFETMLLLLDVYPMDLPARYQNKPAAYGEVWIISNLRLEEMYPSVQESSPEQWKAFLRRIHHYYEMGKDHTMVELQKPTDTVTDAKPAF